MGTSFDFDGYLREQRDRATLAVEEISRILGERGFKMSGIEYSGGNDQGDLSRWFASPVAINLDEIDEAFTWLSEHPEGLVDMPPWPDTHTRTEDGRYVERELTKTDIEDKSLNELAWNVISGKWGGFAGDFEVQGICWIDLTTATMKRVDSVSHTEWTTEVS